MLSPRVLRTGLIGSALAVLTLAGHTAGGGAVDAFGLLLVGVVSVALAAALSARRLSTPMLLGVLLAGQAFLHVLVTMSAGHAHAGPSLPATMMVGAHVLAAGVAAVLIAHADGLAARWQAFLPTVIGAAEPPVVRLASAATPLVIRRTDSRAALVLLLHGVVRRGPPASAVLS